MEYLDSYKLFESKLSQDDIVNDIRDILLDINTVSINLANKTIRIIGWLDNIKHLNKIVWNEDFKSIFIMLGSYLEKNWEVDKVYLVTNTTHISGGKSEELTYDEFLSRMKNGEEILNLLITLI